jgi:hypothetical protein
MDEDSLRLLVREAVARRLQADQASSGPETRPMTFAGHVSHVRYVLPESDGPCFIEPTVHCNHCGYCQSHGH